jgi:hypothetical protein
LCLTGIVPRKDGIEDDANIHRVLRALQSLAGIFAKTLRAARALYFELLL